MWELRGDVFIDAGFPCMHLVTTKTAGNMRDVSCRHVFCRMHGIDAGRLVTAQQVHGNTVAVVDARHAGTEIPGADGLITDDPSVALAIFTADCVPVLLTAGDVCGVVHAGWRGMAKGIIPEAVRLFADAYGKTPASVSAAVGPHIQKCCYEISQDLREIFALGSGATHLDLAAVAGRQLREAGVERISFNGHCTAHEEGLFYSYRKTKTMGRLMSLIRIGQQAG